jgi:Zn-dependent protease
MLKFRLGNIPVRVHLSFLITTVILQMNAIQDLRTVAMWLGIVFVSILVHELGHALAGKAFGLAPEIDLHGMGGTTSWSAGRKLSHGKSILVSLAGPGLGMLFGGALWLVATQTPLLRVDGPALEPSEGQKLAAQAFGMALVVNVGWGVFNLLPILPLDGGNVLRSLLNLATKDRGERPARIVGIVLGLAVGIGAYLWLGSWWIALLGALFAVQNFRVLRDLGARDADRALAQPLEDAYEALKREDGAAVLAIAEPILAQARTDEMRAEAIHLLAYGLLLEHRPDDADRMIKTLPAGYTPHKSYAELRAQLAS